MPKAAKHITREEHRKVQVSIRRLCQKPKVQSVIKEGEGRGTVDCLECTDTWINEDGPLDRQ